MFPSVVHGAVQAASDRLMWEPHYQLGTVQRAVAAVEHSLPWLKLEYYVGALRPQC